MTYIDATYYDDINATITGVWKEITERAIEVGQRQRKLWDFYTTNLENPVYATYIRESGLCFSCVYSQLDASPDIDIANTNNEAISMKELLNTPLEELIMTVHHEEIGVAIAEYSLWVYQEAIRTGQEEAFWYGVVSVNDYPEHSNAIPSM